MYLDKVPTTAELNDSFPSRGFIQLQQPRKFGSFIREQEDRVRKNAIAPVLEKEVRTVVVGEVLVSLVIF